MSGHKSEKKGPNIICRVSNVTPEMVCRYVERLPKRKMEEDAFRNHMGKSWFQNEHQAPEQWGLYYIDGTNYYPRFNHDITIDEANAYLYHWMHNLIVINPYTRFKKQNDKNLVESIVSQLEKDPNEHDLKTIIRRIIDSDEPFVINEIIANALNNYSRALKVEIINKDEERFNVSLLPNYQELLKIKYKMTKKEYFELFDSGKTAFDLNEPLQQIFYGAPGTGKSFKIKKEVEDAGKIYFRTTFHPDSDYSTFVGCYKPTMDKDTNESNIEGVLMDGIYDKPKTKGNIIYSFTPQAFTNAYVKAWQTEEPVFLIIEEINRGNCAQIFGDLFQLLDRDENGDSQYKVDADTDLADYIREHLVKEHKDGTPDFIYAAKELKLQLPNNLYIWATMNTSDQSLFPIDSAFKRRWEWVYSPIAEGKEKDGSKAEWQIEGQGVDSWWKFIQGINEVIDVTTHSEDKKLGYYFCKPTQMVDGYQYPKIITKNTFVNKVVFYLWNDVFKVYGFKSEIFDMKDKNGTSKKITFKSFYKDDGSVNDDIVNVFVKNVMAKAPKENNTEEVQQSEENQTETEA